MVNKAATAVTNAKKKVGSPSLLAWIPRWSSTKGTFKMAQLDFAADDRGVLQPQGSNPINPGGPLCATWDQLLGLAKEIDRMYVGADHRKVTTLPAWTSLYKQAPRNIPYMTSAGTMTSKTVPTIPCHNCGVILPIEFYQVDHHMPQADGDDLHILKVLRALGGTTSGSTGAKAAAYKANTMASHSLNPKGRDRTYNHLSQPSGPGKWDTNELGSAFVSAVVFANARTHVARMCKNSILNLVPLCPECNREKSDYHKPFA